jgi:alpha-beta hydrolase superfamily lysophospholipase
MTTRRRFVGSAIAAAGAAGLPAASTAHGSMMWDYIVGSIRELDESRRQRLARIGTVAQLEALQREVRQRLAEMWGPFPEKRTPLNARRIGTIDRQDYAIEKIVFESRPAFFVTANLYRPREVQGRLPAIVFPLGHTDNGKANPVYQRFPILMARSGFICLNWDPIGQGERLQLWDSGKRASLVGPGTREHSALGRQCYLAGLNLMNYRVWDAMRAIDYLESRPDVDPARIGCAGTSGGGMETLQLAPFEVRIQAAAPSCAVATFRHKTEALLMADPEQNLYGNLGYGIDHPELLATVAPRAVLIGAATQDYVPIEGARRTFEEIKPAFALFGSVEKVALAETNDKHTFNQELREATASWFVRWLAGSRKEVREQPAETLPDPELYCTRTGQVAESLGGETVFTLTRKRAEEIAPRRSLPSSSRQLEVYRRQIVESAKSMARLDLERREEGIHIPVRAVGTGNPVVLVAEAGKDDAAVLRDLVEPLLAAGRRVAGIDVRGWGETRPHMPDRKAGFSWDEFFAYRSMELGRPLFGQRLRDLLVTAPGAAGAGSWDLVGVGAGALLAAYAAAIEPRVRSVVVIGGMLSYRSVIDDPLYRQPLSAFLPGVIGAYEVRDILAAIAPRRLMAINAEDARRQPAAEAVVTREFEWTRNIYRTAGADAAFRIVCRVPAADIGRQAAGWLGGSSRLPARRLKEHI